MNEPGRDVYKRAQAAARSKELPIGFAGTTQDYLTRHALESFLDRLTRSRYGGSFVLKGGLAVSVYDVRRPTKDVDSVLLGSHLSEAHLCEVVRAVAAVEVDDGLVLDPSSVVCQTIRDDAQYPGVRVRVRGVIGSAKVSVTWDVSTGDPITPPPQVLTVPRVLGGAIRLLGYPAEVIVAEKAVTMVERGLANTRWRDFVDVAQLAENNALDPGRLRQACVAVARHRSVTLMPLAQVLDGFGNIPTAQSAWSAWRRKNRVEGISEASLDDQVARVSVIVDPIFEG